MWGKIGPRGVTVPLNPVGCGTGWSCVWPIGRRCTSCPVLLLDFSGVTQTRGCSAPTKKTCFYFSPAGCQASYLLRLRVSASRGELDRIWDETLQLQPRSESKTCFLGGWRTKRHGWPPSTPVYVPPRSLHVGSHVCSCMLSCCCCC